MNDDFLFEMETFFMALADKTRLRLLNLMRGGEVCVYFFTEVLQESQPKVSRHLAYLRNAGVVEARRDGKWMHYRIVAPRNAFAARVLEDTLAWLESQDMMRRDYEKLISAGQEPSAPIYSTRPVSENEFAETDMSGETREELEIFLL
jgi:ArsR family transcriptional regulator